MVIKPGANAPNCNSALNILPVVNWEKSQRVIEEITNNLYSFCEYYFPNRVLQVSGFHYNEYLLHPQDMYVTKTFQVMIQMR